MHPFIVLLFLIRMLKVPRHYRSPGGEVLVRRALADGGTTERRSCWFVNHILSNCKFSLTNMCRHFGSCPWGWPLKWNSLQQDKQNRMPTRDQGNALFTFSFFRSPNETWRLLTNLAIESVWRFGASRPSLSIITAILSLLSRVSKWAISEVRLVGD